MAFEETELRKFSEFGHMAAAAIGVSFEDWAFAESGVILKAWAGRTAVATLGQTDRRTRYRTVRELGFTGGSKNADATISISSGYKSKPFGRVWLRKKSGHGWRRTHDSNFRPLNQHYKRGQWIDLEEAIQDVKLALERALPAAREAIGLARQSVVRIADSLGITLENVEGGGPLSAAGIAKARAAIASNGVDYQNGFSFVERGNQAFFIEFLNRYPRADAMGMDKTLEGVVAGRLKFAERNLEEGVFLSAEETARKYPFVEVRKSAA